jgi:hypothetical protein
MKMKHNKKRNTAFLYESLIKELTKTIIKKENSKKEKILEILKKYFYKNSVLKNELDVYNSVLETKCKDKTYALRLLHESKKDFLSIDRKEVFNQQTMLIKEINESLSNSVFANFISNYRDIATVGQFFIPSDLNSKQRILVETRVLGTLLQEAIPKKQIKHVDNLTYRTFVNKFNNSYGEILREEQKSLLTNYITSFTDNGLGLKVFMNEEIGRIKQKIKNIIKDPVMSESHKKKYLDVFKKVESFAKQPINESVVKDIFYIQDLLFEGVK